MTVPLPVCVPVPVIATAPAPTTPTVAAPSARVVAPLAVPAATDHGSAAIWLAIAAIGLATYAIRLSFIHLVGRVDGLPPAAERALRFVPPAVLAALALPALVTVEPSVGATLRSPRLLAGGVAAVVARRTEDVLATVAAGMVALWAVRFLTPL